jgi:TolB-like protein
MRVGGAEIDLVRRSVRAADGTETELRRQSAEVLRLLAARRGQTVGKEAINDAVWGDIAVTEDSLVQCIGEIRRALGDDRDRLRTVPREGYRLEHDRPVLLPATSGWAARVAAATLGLAVLLAVAGWVLLQRAGPPAAPGFAGPVVAVLPVGNLAGGERWDRLARGMTNEMIATLAGMPWIFVLSDATTRSFAGATPEEIAANLGAEYVVDGSLQANGGQVLLTASLLDARTGRQIWSKRWQGTEGDLLTIQAEAAEALIAEMASAVGPIMKTERAAAGAQSTGSLTAYETFLLSIEAMFRWTPEGFAESRTLGEQAVALDPRFGEGWAHLAYVYDMLILPRAPEAEIAELIRLRNDAARKGLRFSPESPWALVNAAKFVVYPDDPAAALPMLHRAVAVAPNNADVLQYAATNMAMRYPETAGQAEAWIHHAIALNPAATHYTWSLGEVLLVAGRYEEAAAALAEAPLDWIDVQSERAIALAMSGDLPGARAAAERLLATYPDFDIGWYDVFDYDPVLKAKWAEGLRLAGVPERDPK